ncbi:YncE family protein [Nguyenibacter vanlangensis]|uniref:YncE family protein n=1 Tax=Nguyenibacter vanlangensis TaxID=1216886 RepID=A0ABZ3D649_9PROT
MTMRLFCRARLIALTGSFSLLLAACAAHGPQKPEEHVQSVPGFADFIAVEDATVWLTNRGRVEHWSRNGKLAEVPMHHPCGAMAVGFGSLWVADCADGTLNRIDLKTAKISTVVKTGIANPKGETNVVIGDGSIWIASDRSGTITRVDPANNSISAIIPVDADSFYLSFGLGSLWATTPTLQELEKIDPRTNRLALRTPLGADPGFLVAGEGAVWVQEQGDGTVARIAPDTGRVTGRVKVSETLKYGDIDAGGGRIWLRTTDGQTYVVIDPETLEILARTGKQTGSGALRYTNAGVWTTSHDIHTLSWWSPTVVSLSEARQP